MSFSTKKSIFRSPASDQGIGGKDTAGIERVRSLGKGLIALRRAADLNQTSVVRIGGRRVAILPLGEYRRVERLLEQEENEKELDRLDLEEAERILNDPTEVSIPYEQVRRELGIDLRD